MRVVRLRLAILEEELLRTRRCVPVEASTRRRVTLDGSLVVHANVDVQRELPQSVDGGAWKLQSTVVVLRSIWEGAFAQRPPTERA